MELKGFSKYILDNHPDPDSLLDTGNIHTQMTKLGNDYAEYYHQKKLNQLKQ